MLLKRLEFPITNNLLQLFHKVHFQSLQLVPETFHSNLGIFVTNQSLIHFSQIDEFTCAKDKDSVKLSFTQHSHIYPRIHLLPHVGHPVSIAAIFTACHLQIPNAHGTGSLTDYYFCHMQYMPGGVKIQ
jgi:hypothetical protein